MRVDESVVWWPPVWVKRPAWRRTTPVVGCCGSASCCVKAWVTAVGYLVRAALPGAGAPGGGGRGGSSGGDGSAMDWTRWPPGTVKGSVPGSCGTGWVPPVRRPSWAVKAPVWPVAAGARGTSSGGGAGSRTTGWRSLLRSSAPVRGSSETASGRSPPGLTMTREVPKNGWLSSRVARLVSWRRAVPVRRAMTSSTRRSMRRSSSGFSITARHSSWVAWDCRLGFTAEKPV